MALALASASSLPPSVASARPFPSSVASLNIENSAHDRNRFRKKRRPSAPAMPERDRVSRVHLWQSWQEDAKGPTRQAKSTTKLGLDDAPPRPALPNLNSRAAVNTRLLLVTYPPVLLILRHIVVH